ncbi:Tfp pilus assembly protein PilF [Granulicella aggregans]|uniref:Tfp pilus assembly protein PilF n=1 Tax=Granulicella aggregans TaxID=474949 RepID=A0A7W8E4L0_9BACT|nr:tetratricopeptide repeat protein [Granulicella aggregans]MBB5058636.1 Tfp pilus assembly protein PilF [Granulicella aggregans]
MGQNSNRDNQPGSPIGTIDSVRLDSWKEIASYLHRDARTVRRWERERRLPVHRVPGGERSGVFAYVDELDRWLRASDAVPVESSRITSEVEAVAEESSPVTSALLIIESLPGGILLTPVTANLEEERVGSTVRDEALQMPSSSSKEDAGSFSNLLTSSSFRERRSPPQRPPVEKSRWAFYGMALLLIVGVIAGSSFAVVHYRRFHAPGREIAHSNPEAKELYLRGRYFWNLRTESGLNQAIDLFTQSIVNDPHYAPAYAGLADSYLLLRQYGHMSDAEAYPRALAAARQAVVLDPSSPDAHRSIAFILRFWNWDMAAAEKEYLRAIELDPKNSQSHHWYATALFSAGRLKEALAQIDLARSLEPQSVSVLADRGLILSSEDPDRGAQALRQVAQSQPEFASVHSYLSRVYLSQGEYSEFLSESRTFAAMSNEAEKVALLDQARKDLETHGPVFMLRNLASSYAPLADSGHASAYSVAQLFGIAGDEGRAIHYLQVACDRRDPGFLSFESDVAFRQVRTTPEYLALLARKDAMPIARLDRPNSL